MVDATSSVPHDLQGHHCGGRCSKVAGKRILQGEVVLQVQGVHFERGRPCAEVYLDGVGWENDRPKQAILGKPGVEIVELRRPSRGVDVNSHEREGALPHVPISPDVDALHERHMVHGRGQDLLLAGLPVRTRDRRVHQSDT